jgi:anhydro-N-acetylmuramic acid kinase
MKTDLYIGLMSGTSLDGIDAVLVDFDAGRTTIHATHEHAFPAEIHAELLELIEHPHSDAFDQTGELDCGLGELYAETVHELLTSANISAAEVTAVGCHGQTVLHEPDAIPPRSIQLGDGTTIATGCGITTVNDFRSADIELGGQGAPLVPAFHDWAFGSDDSASMVVNIGGIANVTLLQPGKAITGFDTGPGNTLLDLWCMRHQNLPYDANGAWARSGKCHEILLKNMLDDPYFSRQPPKSTGREYFHSDWLDQQLSNLNENPIAVDVQATLTELTAASIAAAAQTTRLDHLWLCGGGALNSLLVERISKRLGDVPVQTTAVLGIAPEWVEAVAFAWLARARLQHIPAGIPSVTGARQAAILGTPHSPPAN